jgi:hypothetical protein
MPIANSLPETVFATAYDVSPGTFRRQLHLEPEKKLMLAVLEDAIACFQKYAFTRDRKGKMLFQEAEFWVQNTNSDWPFSFANVCETLVFDPDYLRQGLAKWKAAKVGEPGKGQDLSAGPKEREEKERHCRNRKSQAPFAQSCQLMSVQPIASISRRMRVKFSQ